jgi:hypothetical protein
LIFSTKSSDFGITEHICSPIMRVSMVSNDVFLSPCLPSVLYIQYTAFPTSLIISSVEVRFQQRMPCDHNHYRFSCATTLPPRTTSYHLVPPRTTDFLLLGTALHHRELGRPGIVEGP